MGVSSAGVLQSKPPKLLHDPGRVKNCALDSQAQETFVPCVRDNGITAGVFKGLSAGERKYFKKLCKEPMVSSSEDADAKAIQPEKSTPPLSNGQTEATDLVAEWVKSNYKRIEHFKANRMWRNYDVKTQRFGQILEKSKWTMEDCAELETLLQSEIQVATSWCFLIAVALTIFHFCKTGNWAMLGFNYMAAMIVLYATRSVRQLCTTKDAPMSSRVFHILDGVMVFYYTIETMIMKPVATTLLIQASKILASYKEDGMGVSFLLKLKSQVRTQLVKVSSGKFWISYAGNIIAREQAVMVGLWARVTDTMDIIIQGSTFTPIGVNVKELKGGDKETYCSMITSRIKLTGENRKVDELVKRLGSSSIAESIKGKIKANIDLSGYEKTVLCRQRCQLLNKRKVKVTPLVNEKTKRGDIKTLLLMTNDGDLLINTTKSENFFVTIGWTLLWVCFAALTTKSRRQTTNSEIEFEELVNNSPKYKKLKSERRH